MRDSLAVLVRKKVEVLVRGGVIYRGVFIEASEDTIHLKGDSGWVTVPMEKVVSVREQGAEEKEWKDRFVDPSFFKFK